MTIHTAAGPRAWAAARPATPPRRGQPSRSTTRRRDSLSWERTRRSRAGTAIPDRAETWRWPAVQGFVPAVTRIRTRDSSRGASAAKGARIARPATSRRRGIPCASTTIGRRRSRSWVRTATSPVRSVTPEMSPAVG
jgi:hypothetical protein